MSRLGKICWLLSGFSLLVGGVSRMILGQWLNVMSIPLILFVVFLVLALAKDFALYLEFMTMRTTKHGMNMGVLILLVLLLIGTLNFLAVRNDKSFDWTSEGLNTLSDQTKKLIASLDNDLEIKYFYKKSGEEQEQSRGQFRDLMSMYQALSNKIQVQYIDSIKRPDLAKEFEVDRGGVVVYLRYKGKKNRIDQLTEEGVTTAILKSTRTHEKVIYALTGHGELDLSVSDPEGGSDFKKALEDSGYQVKTLNLVETPVIPADGSLIVIVGPKFTLLEPELKTLRNFARSGGHFFIAADPDKKHNIAQLVKSLGVEYQNDFILDQVGQLLGASAAMALGVQYSQTSPITKDFNGMMTVFNVATSLKRAPDADVSLVTEDLVKTGQTSFTTREITGNKVKVDGSTRGPHTVAIGVTGKMSKEEGAGTVDKEYSAVVVGDSDFLSNQLLFQHLNRDLVVNSVADLLKDSNLISIRPKQPKGITLDMTETQFYVLLFGIFIPLPIILFFTGGVFWYRRRAA